MPPAIVRAGIIVAACTLTNVQDLAGAAPADGELRTFTLSKPAASRASTAAPPALLPPDRPPETERLTISAGVGYVQGADWGTELRAGGSIAGFLIDLDSLTTKGARGVLFDHGAATVTAPSRRWNATAGDVFSPLAGPGRGARLGWLTTPNHRMSVTYFTPWRGARQRFTRVLLRNELSIGGRSAMSAELSTDRSYRVEGRVRAGRF
ncbi:MAG TPA: hypothetical protein VM032_13820, partial [Vicinamibacterales bacterium]|nr:hypothetical protein [Vicinamibacterales bacterium]